MGEAYFGLFFFPALIILRVIAEFWLVRIEKQQVREHSLLSEKNKFSTK